MDDKRCQGYDNGACPRKVTGHVTVISEGVPVYIELCAVHLKHWNKEMKIARDRAMERGIVLETPAPDPGKPGQGTGMPIESP